MPQQASELGTRPIGSLLWESCSQSTVAVGMWGVYALSNAWFVARGVGPDALAAVNLVAPVLTLLGALGTMVGVGGASVVSRALGANDPRTAALAAGACFGTFWSAAVVVTLVGLLLLNPLLDVLGAQGVTRTPASQYAVILLLGAVTATGFSSLVRAEGRLRFSMMLWIIPICVHIALDPLLILGLHWGIGGAALGTVGGQAVSAGMSLWFFFVQRDRPYRVHLRDMVPSPRLLGSILALGAPSFLTGLGATVLAVLVNERLAAVPIALAAFSVVARLQTFANAPQAGIAQGLQPVVGYNAGAGAWHRVAVARRGAITAMLAYGVLIGLVLALAAPWWLRLFVSDAAIVATGVHALRVLALGIACAGLVPLVASYHQTLGHAVPAHVLTLGTLLVVKIPLVLVLGRRGPGGLWWALALGEVVGAVCAAVLLRRTDHGEPA